MLASFALRAIRTAGLPMEFASTVGSLRRYAPDVGEISILAVVPPRSQCAFLDALPAVLPSARVTARNESSLRLGTDKGSLTVHVAAPEHAGAALAWHTGSKQHVRGLQSRAGELGLLLDEGRLLDSSGSIAVPTEDEFYRRLQLPHIAPELREDDDVIERAERGELPNLVSQQHIRGDLHVHTVWSDGRDSAELMVSAARQLGYQYVAITDHSERAWSSRKLAAVDIPRQREEILALRNRFKGIAILHGVEVEIMQDGSLDFEDSVLCQFDIVLASLHDHAGHGSPRLTERYLKAIEHPLVNVITHPANRTPAGSKGYDVDFDRIFASAIASGTALEVDGAPGHLDMDGALARRAVAAGVTVTIDSDSHRADALDRQMRFGIGTACRGGVEPAHVLNTRDVDAVRHFVAVKRASH